MRDLRILVTGVGALVAPSIIKNYKIVSERNIYIVGVDIKPLVNNKYIDKYYQYKMPSDKDYIAILLDICKKEKIDFLIPLVDEELLILSKNKALFESNDIVICVNDAEKIKLIQNKYNLYKYLEKENIQVPKSITFNTAEELLSGCKLLGFPQNKLCYKPVVSSGSRGFRIIQNDIDYEDYLFKQKPDSRFISLNFLVDSMKKCKEIPKMMLMEYIEGDLYNVNVLASHGKVLYSVAGKVIDFALGNTLKCQIENNHEVLEYCRRISELLTLDGNIGFEVAYTKDKVLKLIEINIRVQGQIYSSTLAGVNFPYLELKYHLKEKLPSNIKLKEVVMVRYLEDILLEDL